MCRERMREVQVGQAEPSEIRNVNRFALKVERGFDVCLLTVLGWNLCRHRKSAYASAEEFACASYYRSNDVVFLVNLPQELGQLDPVRP